MVESIKTVLIKRDGMTAEEADKRIAEAKKELSNLLLEGDEDAAYHICENFFGLEPDYIMDLIE